jgi:hypothetical protein
MIKTSRYQTFLLKFSFLVIKKSIWAGGVAQVVECLPSKCKPCIQTQLPKKKSTTINRMRFLCYSTTIISPLETQGFSFIVVFPDCFCKQSLMKTCSYL